MWVWGGKGWCVMMECAVVCVGCKGWCVMMECAVVLLVLVVGCIARWWGQMLVRVGVLVVWCRVMGVLVVVWLGVRVVWCRVMVWLGVVVWVGL